jgi:membrane protease YdiL (CAAX protease family)
VTTFRATVVTAVCLHLMTFPVVHFFLRGERLTWAEAFGFNARSSARSLGLTLGVTVIALPGAWLLIGLSSWALRAFGAEPALQPAVTAVQTSEGLPHQLVLAFIAILLAPAAEEVLFRGILYPFLKLRGQPLVALWSTALLFGAVHFNKLTFLSLVFFGAILTWLYERTGNLHASILAHSLFNLANFIWMVAGI